jgi:predicted NAD/FAD-dependent oxidoreductase
MERIIPLHGSPTLVTWAETSAEVFERMLQGVSVELNAQVTSVTTDNAGRSVIGGYENLGVFDAVVFACPSPETSRLLVRWKRSVALPCCRVAWAESPLCVLRCVAEACALVMV